MTLVGVFGCLEMCLYGMRELASVTSESHIWSGPVCPVVVSQEAQLGLTMSGWLVLVLLVLVVVQSPDDVPQFPHGKVRAPRLRQARKDIQWDNLCRVGVRLGTSLSPLPGYLHLTAGLVKVVPKLCTGSRAVEIGKEKNIVVIFFW